MQIELHEKAITDFQFWEKSGNRAIQNKIQALFTDMLLHPFYGIGKPEMLKHELSGKWSRRINEKHRIVYDVVEDILNIYSLRGHY
ncbi:Txe/YoeB family addiction module toxin [Pedobacter miscanthi]|uniref:Putative mRNA interferase YoeB n=1 Tax=Pedobacter miscanthi TaxID=2259170 RepID=A0A366L5Y3_9SPHI|nr:Txe/YoeB family addiction module toxin [Pedobacter miscanthi]RBQ08899.1 Txe/YoeB family addiction module toxin [Pedobacter miscanthi]